MINDYEIAKCNNCYFLFQVHIPDNNSIKVLYETIINYKMSLGKDLEQVMDILNYYMKI